MDESDFPRAGAIRAVVQALNAGDALGDEVVEDVVVDLSRMRLEPVVLRGRAAWSERTAERAAVMAGGRIEVELLCEDGDRVLALVTVTATGRSSGATAAARTAHLYEFDGETVARVTYYDREDGVDAMGLAGARLRRWLRGNAAFGSRDADAFLSCLTDDAELTTLFGGAGHAVLRGEQQIRTYLRDLKATWTSLELEVGYVRFAGDVSLTRALARGTGRESDVEVRQPVWLVTAWRGDLGVRHASYLEYDAALDAFRAGGR